MQGRRRPQPSGTNRPSSYPSISYRRGCRLARDGCRAMLPVGSDVEPQGPSPRCAAPRARGSARTHITTSWWAERRPPVSGHGGRGTPGPIPNPEAKPPSADGTAGGSPWESRAPLTGGRHFHVGAERGPSGPRSFPLFRHPFLISKLSICHPLFGWIAILLYSYISAERLIIFTLPWTMMQ